MSYVDRRVGLKPLVEPDVVNPVDEHKNPPHRVQQRNHYSNGRGEDGHTVDYVLRQDLAGEKEEVRRGRPHRMVVPAGETPEHERQRQEQPHRRPHHHVGPERSAAPEQLPPPAAACPRAGGGEREAREGDDVEGGESGEDEVEQGDEAAGGENHDEGHQLELDHPQGAHHPAHDRGILALAGGDQRRKRHIVIGARSDDKREAGHRCFGFLLGWCSDD